MKKDNKKITFLNAVKLLKNGKCVRRPSWEKDSYWKLGTDEVICWKDGKTAHIHVNQIFADDWEEWKDRCVKCIYCNKPIHTSNFAGIKKEGLFCDNICCLMRLIKEQEEKEYDK